MIIFLRNDQWDEKSIKFFETYKTVLPEKGVPYTIREVVLRKGEYVLLLNEIVNNVNSVGEVGFHYSRFSEDPESELNNVIAWEDVNDFYFNQF